MDLEGYNSTFLISTLSSIALASLLLYYKIHQKKNSKQADQIPVFKNSVELIWNGSKPCFCRNKIVLNINSTPPHTHKYYCETIAHIFGISDAKQLIIRDAETETIVNSSSGDEWFVTMINGKTFLVSTKDESSLSSKYQIKDMAAVIGQFSKVKLLSQTFYNRVWNDIENDDFRQTFILNSKSVEEAADNQSRWLWEMWGGKEAPYTTKHGDGTIFKRMLARHSKSRMSFDNACIWLKHMKLATVEIFEDDHDFIVGVFTYWLHFLAFFQYNSKERQTFQSILFDNI